MQAPVRLFAPKQTLLILCLISLFVGIGGKSWGQTTALSITSSSTITDNVGSYAGSSATLPTYWGQQGTGSTGNSQQGTNQTGGTSGGWYGSGVANAGGMSYLGSGNATNGNGTIVYQNNTGSTISGFTISFLAKMFKNGTSSPTVSVSWNNSASLVVQTQGALTNPLTSLSFSDATTNISTGVTLTQTVSSITVANGQYIYIRWIHSGGSSSDNLGWNNIQFTPTLAAAATNLYWGGTTSAYTGAWTSGTPWGTTTTSGAITAWPSSGLFAANFSGAGSVVTIPSAISVAPTNVLVGATTTFTTATGTNGVLSAPVALSAALTTAPATSTTLSLSGIISGSSALTQSGAGILSLSSANTYSGGTSLAAGTLQLGAAGVLNDAGFIGFNGGTLGTGATTGFSETVGTATLFSSSTIALGSGSHTLTFANSSSNLWATTGAVLNITGWSGTAGASGTAGKIFFGNAAGGLTATQLSQITFSGFTHGTQQLSTGEIVPAAATITPSSTTLTGFSYVSGSGPSAAQSFTLSASYLTSGGGTITVTAPADYEVSTTSATAGFGASANLAYTGTGALASNTIYVRLKAGLAIGNYNSETVSISGGTGNGTATVTVSGSVTAPVFTINPTSIAFGTALVGANTAGTSVSISISGLIGAPGTLTVTAPSTDFQVSTDNVTYTSSITLPYTSATFSGTFYVRFSPQSINGKSGNVNITGGGATTGTVGVTGTGANASITLGTLSPASPYCAGATVSIPFTYSPTVGYGNATFTAQLSSSIGSFTTPVTIGTTASDGTGGQTISAVIPAASIAGTAYRIRVVSTNPSATSGTSAALTINTIPAQPSAITGATSVCSGLSQVYSVTSVTGVTYTWTFPTGWVVTAGAGTASITVTPSATGGNVIVTPSTTCGNGTPQTLAVTSSSPLSAAPVATSATTVFTTGFTANWNAVTGVDNYYIDVYTKGTVNTTVTEGFENGTTAPTGWTFTSITATYNTPGNYGLSSPSVRFDGTNDRVQTSALATPATQLSFWIKGQGTNGSSSLLVEGYNGTAWVTVQNITSIPTTGTTFIYNSTSTVTLPANLIQFRFTYTQGAGNLAFDDVSLTTSGIGPVYVSGYQNLNTGNTTSYAVAGLTANTNYYYVVRASNGCGATINSNEIPVTTTATCTSPVAITSFLPTSGPAFTLVSIKGTGMSAATGVFFGGVPAASYTIQGDTTIIAEVPANAASATINITTSTCPAVTASAFTLLTTSGTCGNSGTASDLMISEIYDAAAGSLSYIEVFNGTTADIPLTNYAVRITTGSNTSVDYALSGTIISGGTYIVSVGNSPTSCSVTVNSANPSGGGFNGNDRVYLLKSNAIIDYVPNPNYNNGSGADAPGFSQIRNATATGPSTTYIASQWTIYNAESCSNLGVGPFTPGASAITVSAQPVDVNCTAVTFSVTTGGSGTGTNTIVWKYNDPSSQTGWSNASLLNGVNGLAVSATTTGNVSTLTITGTTGFLYNYQFYAEVSRGTCVLNSNAAQYSYESRLYYRTKTPVTAGVWADPSNWEMSNDKVNYVNACQFPTSANSLSAEVVSGAKLTMNYNYTLKQLIVDAGAELATNAASSQLTILNGNPTGADFIVNGTFTDNASSTNNLVLSSATWQLGSNGTFIKTNNSSAAVYRDNYEGGMSTIPATANWIIRKSTATSVEFTTVNTYYPNLTFDNATTTPYTFSSTAGNTGNMRVLSNLDIGGATAATGAVTFINNNTNAASMLINGNMVIRAGSVITNAVSSGTPGTGFELKGNLTTDGTLTANGGGSTGLFSFTGTTQQTVSGTGIINFNNVTVNNTATATNKGVLLNRNITVGGALALTNGPLVINGNTLTLSGGVTHTNGSFVGSATSNMTLNGSAAKALYFTLPGNVLHNVFVDATASNVTLDNPLDITSGTQAAGTYGTLICNGVLNANGNLTLKSDFYGTASVGTSSGNIQGNVTVERFTSASSASPTASRRAWRLFTSPVTGVQIHTAWQENGINTNIFGTIITGEGFSSSTTAGAKGYDYIGYGNHASIRQYSSAANIWQILPATGSGTFIDVRSQPAFMLFIRGDRSTTTIGQSSTAIIRATGTLLQGPQNPAIETGSAYTLIGNPYASTIDFNSIYLNNSSKIQRKFYIWDSKRATYGSYVLVDYNTSSGQYQVTPKPFTTTTVFDDARYISSNAGFFVAPINNTITGTVNIVEGDKKAANQPVQTASTFREVPADTKELLVNLNMKDNDTLATLADGFRVRFDNAFIGNEEESSSQKSWNFNENLNLVRGGKYHIIEARGDVKKTDTLFMQMWNVSQRDYQLQVKGENFASATGVHAWIEDNFLNTKQELALNGDITTVDFSVTGDSASSKIDRFRIVFTNSATTLPVTVTKVTAQPQNGGVQVNWNVANETNIKGYTVEKSTDGRAFTGTGAQQPAKNNPQAAFTNYSAYDAHPKIGDNYYRIRIEGNDGKVTYSEVVKVTITANGSGIQITLYPNPVREGKANLQLANLAEGTYLVSVYTAGGQTLFQKKVAIAQSDITQNETLLLGNTVPQGSYQIRVADNKRKVLYSDKLVVGR